MKVPVTNLLLVMNVIVTKMNVPLKEQNHVFAHAQEFDFCLGGQEFKDARIDIDFSQIRLHRPQSTLALP